MSQTKHCNQSLQSKAAIARAFRHLRFCPCGGHRIFGGVRHDSGNGYHNVTCRRAERHRGSDARAFALTLLESQCDKWPAAMACIPLATAPALRLQIAAGRCQDGNMLLISSHRIRNVQAGELRTCDYDADATATRA